jgi:L-rhamnonate dehydratase
MTASARTTTPVATGVEAIVKPFSTGTWLDEQQVATPLAPFPRFRAHRSSWRGPGADAVYVLITTDVDGVFGVGQTRGGSVVRQLVVDHLRPLLIGQNPLEIGIRHEEMTRASQPYARGGVGSMAVSAVELALWDLSARAIGLPLYRLLGGSTTPLPYYVTIGPDEPDDSLASIPAAADPPQAVKVAMPYAPRDGAEGMRRNIETVAKLRDIVGPAVPIAVDCFMSWNLGYTLDFARQARPFGLGWIEEPLPVTAVSDHALLRNLAAPVQIAAGEHIFDPALAYHYLEQHAIDILQLDVTWCGGIRTAAALGFAALQVGVVFAPHASGIQPWATHLLSTFGPTGLAEVIADVGAAASSGQRWSAPVARDLPGVGIDPVSLGFIL